MTNSTDTRPGVVIPLQEMVVMANVWETDRMRIDSDAMWVNFTVSINGVHANVRCLLMIDPLDPPITPRKQREVKIAPSGDDFMVTEVWVGNHGYNHNPWAACLPAK